MARYNEPVQITFPSGGAPVTLTISAPEAGVVQVDGLPVSTGQKLIEAAQSPRALMSIFDDLFGHLHGGPDLPEPHEADTLAPGAEQAVAPQPSVPEYKVALVRELGLLQALQGQLAEGLALPEGRVRRVQTTFRAEVNGQPFTKEDWVEVRDPLDPDTRNTLVQRWKSSLRRAATGILLQAVETGVEYGVPADTTIGVLLRGASAEMRALMADTLTRRARMFAQRFKNLSAHHPYPEGQFELTRALWEERRFDPFALGPALDVLERLIPEPMSSPRVVALTLLGPAHVTYGRVVTELPHAQL